MATSSVMQSTLVSPVTGIVRGLGSSRTAPCTYMPPRQQRNSGRVVRCMAEDGKDEEVVRTTATPPPKPKVSTDFFDVFAFSGPAPERINGRLAMIGFVAAIAVELSKASLIPLFSGVSVESKSNGLFTSDAEMWNGRFAMLGLVALAFTEFVKGGALV
ncbi:hypothetical protein Vadar_007667 [Vaccinium darrowii]|uniref:Uncharacterized protein n=1 Tax=Vaccinium darrowii TaxID=229202 RepID=A0ACB7YTI4_9ERIC|nr:hypothetical protein Vadar_007667 [Vaccinium darrowii]